VLLLAIMSLAGLRAAVCPFCGTASRFVRYYQALEKSDRPVGLWERVVYSLMLANVQQPAPAVARSSS
jgi:hypothetical protein